MDFEKVREQCFEEGRSYKNQYVGGIVEYICMLDHRPCCFQCLKDVYYNRKKQDSNLALESDEYQIE